MKVGDKAYIVGYSVHFSKNSVVTLIEKGEKYDWICQEEKTGLHEGFNEKDLVKLP